MKIHFITYGSEFPINFKYALERIKKEAVTSKWFDKITIYTSEKLNKKFKMKYGDILKKPRGGGYFIWKIQIIKQELELIKENDIIVYLDAGSSINKYGKSRFDQYIKMLNNSPYGFLAFVTNGGRSFMTQELIDYFNKDEFIIDSSLLEKDNYIGTHLIIQKNEHSRLIINEYEKLLNYDKYLITDKYNQINKKLYLSFKDYRHEQSILSLLFKLYDCVHVTDPHYFGNRENGLNNPESKKYPFLALRQRGPTKEQLKIISKKKSYSSNQLKMFISSKKIN